MRGVDVLVVDDDEDIRVSLTRGLRLSGFAVRTAADGTAALSNVKQQRPDVVVLDVNLPGLSGVDVVGQLRALGVDVPVCILSAHDAVPDRIAGLEAGADDYPVKPFALDELVARLRALLRRRQRPEPHERHDTVRRPAHHRYRRANRPPEWRRSGTHQAGVRTAGNSGTQRGNRPEPRTLARIGMGYDFPADTNVVDVFVGYLRRKLEVNGAPRLVHTVRGVGFVLWP